MAVTPGRPATEPSAAPPVIVLGLQRAFQLSGARTAVTSLWSVDDRALPWILSQGLGTP